MNLTIPIILYVIAALLASVALAAEDIRALGISVISIIMALMIKENDEKDTSS